ncbi:ATP-binding cassette domain-containing protein [Comamonas antarctica]|uniref:ATP-binding cassette domain-containing protein n=1 Tax=Comamonas antarctica TaxID=2743470 RepID=UPI0028EAC625|nr:ATP-binding cassette domain-containing protein [Comamonas antarctica]
MSIIPQEAKLFDRSVYANATYGLEHVPYDQVQTLLLGLKLERLQRQEGACWLDAGVGKDGLDLSGGERQRILLARAILQARPLLLLDEATSALDAQTEAAVLQLLHERLPDTTIVAVSHRPHAQQAGYRTLALDQGAMP